MANGLQIWTIASGMDAPSAHVTLEQGEPSGVVLAERQDVLKERSDIDHVKLRLDPVGFHQPMTEPRLDWAEPGLRHGLVAKAPYQNPPELLATRLKFWK